ncbi:MAG: FHA domain-containing protein [Pseudomonadales bacterium]
MQFLLKPPPDSGLAPIEVSRKLFPVGRREPPFDAYPKSAVAKLSKRHARLFAEGTAVYVVDLGSLNGSTCNGSPIKDAPVALANGDVLTFGGLTYEFELQQPPGAPAAAEQRLRLVLKPALEDSLLEPVVISSFPFLINKNSDLFARYATTAPDALAYLSRNHAQIIRLADEFHIEDLGSTNGTFLNDDPIEEHIRQLTEGDLISLGGERLQYRVFITDATTTAKVDAGVASDATMVIDSEGSAEAPPPAPEVSEVLDSSRTIFVDSATSFIDVYFNEQQAEVPVQDNAQAADRPAAGTGQQSVGTAIATTMFGQRLSVGRVVSGLLLIAGIGSAVIGFQHWRNMHWRSLERLQTEGAHEQALAQANELLAEHADDARLQAFATDSMLKTLLKPWMDLFQSTDFDAAQAQIDRARDSGDNNPTDDALLDLLQWATEVQAFLHGRDATPLGTTAGVDPFADAIRVGNLLTVWTEDANQRAREMRELQEAEPAFETVHAEVFANVRRLRGLELDAVLVRDLESDLTANLATDDSTAVRDNIDALLKANDALFGAQLIRAELSTYETLQQAIAKERWLDAYELSASSGFRTAPFQRYAESLAGQTLPDQSFMNRYRDALNLWRDGEFHASENALQALLNAGWPAIAQQRLEYQRKQLARWQELQVQRNDSGYARALFDFYAELDHIEDQGLINELRPDFMAHSREALSEATASFASAERDWQRYRDAGGIQTEHRLEAQVSSTFTKLAGLLQSSFENFSRGLQIYQQLSVKPSKAWTGLHADLLREVAVQRSALSNLQVLAPTVRDGKLALLPNV